MLRTLIITSKSESAKAAIAVDWESSLKLLFLTCKANVTAHLKVLDGLLFASGEAVDDAGRESIPVPRQKLDQLDVGVAFVKEQRFLQITSELDLKGRGFKAFK